MVEWADAYRVIARQNSANPGPWKTSRVPIAYGPMLAITERDTQIITLVACTQIVKSEFLQNVAGYFIHQDPASILFVQPTQKLAESFSKERFSPTRDATPALRELIPDAKSRDSGVTITHKEYPGGTLDFVGANSPVDLASRPKRIVLSDEIDLYPADAGGMGDPLALAEERSSTFKKRRKNVRVCSPSDEATSRIHREYLASDQRRCFVACPHCEHEQVLRWSRETVIWDRDADGNHLPHTVRYHCEACGAGWSEAERTAALRSLAGKPDHGWRQTRPFRCCGEEHIPARWDAEGRSLCPSCGERSFYSGHAGFHVSKLYSTRHDLADVVKEWLGAQKSPDKLRKFVNTALAEVWKEKVEALDSRALADRREAYTHDTAPEAVRLVVFGADTQDDRIEVTFLGYGDDEEVWVLRHEVLLGDTAKKTVWDELDDLIKQPIHTVDGRSLTAQAGCIDTQGHRGEMVHAFCRVRKSRRIYPVAGRGNDERGSKMIWPKTPSRTKNAGDRLYIVGVDTAKDALLSALTILPDPNGEPVPRAVHFPQEGLSADYFEQLTAERAVVRFKNNVGIRKWTKKEEGARNEALDCFVYGMAARLSLPTKLHRRVAPRAPVEEIAGEAEVGEEHATVEQVVAAKVTDRAARRRAWANR